MMERAIENTRLPPTNSEIPIGGQIWVKTFAKFTKPYIHCIVSRNGERIPRPLPAVLHGEKPSVVVHANFIYREPAEKSNLKYVLII